MTDLTGTVDGGILPTDLKEEAARLVAVRKRLEGIGQSSPNLKAVTDAVEEIAVVLQGLCGHLLRHADALQK